MIELVKQGQPMFAVSVEPSQDAESILSALLELVEHLQKCVAQVNWFRRGVSDPDTVRLVLEYAPHRKLGRDTYEICAAQQEVRLIGSTPQGVEYAVYHFLEHAFGVRWLWPGPEGTVTPKAVDVTWPSGTQRHKPAWEWRRLWLGGAFFEEDDPILAELKYASVQPGTLQTLHRWQRRQRLGGLNIADGHRWAQICSPLVYGESHPEFFALVNGQRDTAYYDGKHYNQPCTTNPEVVELTANYVISCFHARPDLDGFSLSLNDSGHFCECKACRDLDQWANAGADAARDATFDRMTEEVHAPGMNSQTPLEPPLTDRVFHFANQVAERVASEYPNKLLLMLVYGPYRHPPAKVRLHPNVIAQFCVCSWSHCHPSAQRRDMEILDKLQQSTSRRGIYDYFVNGKIGSVPRGFASVFERSLKTYHDQGCRYFATQAGLDFATNGFAYYFASRLLWDMNQSYDEVLKDYCRSGFGPAHSAVQKYLNAYVQRWEEVCPISICNDAELMALELYPPPWRQARRDELASAQRLAARLPAVLARLGHLEQGLDFLDCYYEAALTLQHLSDAGAPLDDEPTAQAEWFREHLNLARKAAAPLDRLDRWITNHADGFAIAAMWMRYQMRHNRMGRVAQVIGHVENPRRPLASTEDLTHAVARQ